MLNFLPLLQYDSITCDEKKRQEEVEPTSEHPNWSFLDKLLARRQQFGFLQRITLAVWLAHKIQEMVKLEMLAMFFWWNSGWDFGHWRDSYAVIFFWGLSSRSPQLSPAAWNRGLNVQPKCSQFILNWFADVCWCTKYECLIDTCLDRYAMRIYHILDIPPIDTTLCTIIANVHILVHIIFHSIECTYLEIISMYYI